MQSTSTTVFSCDVCYFFAGEDKESTPMYLTPIKNGEQIVWLKETSREADSELTGDEYESNRSKTENRPTLSSDAEKEGESNEEKGQKDEESGKNGRRKSTTKTKRSERRKRRLEWNEDAFVENVNRERSSNRIIMGNKAMEGNVELEFTSEDCSEKRPDQRKRNVEANEKELVKNVNQESVGEKQILEGIVEREFTSQSLINERSEQKQRKLQDNEQTLKENVNQKSVGEKQKLEGNVEPEFTSQSLTKNKTEQKQTELQENEDTREENVNEESVDDRRIISQQTLEGNRRFQVTSQSPIKKKTERKLQENKADTLEENVNEQSVDDRGIISEQTEGNGRFELTSQSPIKKKTEQKQPKLQENEDTREENVNEESVDDRRTISQQTLEGNETFESPIKKKTEQTQRKLQENEDAREENVNEESVDDRRIISQQTLEGNGRFESPIKKKTERKLQENKADTLEGNVNEESVDDRGIISEQTEGNGRFEFTSQRLIKKKTEQKQRKLQENEDTLEGNVNEESVDDRGIISEQTEGNGRFEFISQSLIKKKRSERKRGRLEDEDTLEVNVNQQRVDDTRIISEIRLEENDRFRLTSHSPIKEKSEQKQRKLQVNEDTREENVNEESVDGRRIISVQTLEGYGGFELTSQSPIKKKRSDRKRQRLEDEDTLEENVNEESANGTIIASKKWLQNNVELERALQDHDNNNNMKVALKRKTVERKWGVRRESDSQESVGIRTPKVIAREDAYCEDKQQNDDDKKTPDRKTIEGANSISDGLQEGNQIEMSKKNKKKKKEKRKRKSELSGTEISPESTPKSSLDRKALEGSSNISDGLQEENKREMLKKKKKKKKEKRKRKSELSGTEISPESTPKFSRDRKTLEGSSNISDGLQEENQREMLKKNKKKKKEKRKRKSELSGTEISPESTPKSSLLQKVQLSQSKDQQNELVERKFAAKAKNKKKEKKRKGELNNMESATKIPSSPTLQMVTGNSLDDSGYSENGHTKSNEQCKSGNQPRISRKRKVATDHEKETRSGHGMLV